MIFLDYVLVIVSVVLITLVALQAAKGDLGEALTGGNSELFKNQKERGAELLISRATLISTVLLVVLGLVRMFMQ